MVVNAYAPTSESFPVSLAMSVDLPTEGKPTNATVASPDFLTSKPDAGPLLLEWASCASILRLSAAIFAFSLPR